MIWRCLSGRELSDWVSGMLALLHFATGTQLPGSGWGVLGAEGPRLRDGRADASNLSDCLTSRQRETPKQQGA
jgi:hypothetical protein